MTFKMHGLERTRESQGFEVGSYNLVAAGSVLHATADLERTTRNLRTALKAGGRAFTLEVVVPDDVGVSFSFRLAREEWRRKSPLLNEEQWDGCLRGSGYSGNDLVLRDTKEDGCYICRIIVSTAVKEEASTPAGVEARTIMVVDDNSETQVDLASLVRNKMGTRGGKHVDIIVPLDRFHETRPGSGDIVLCLASLDESHEEGTLAATCAENHIVKVLHASFVESPPARELEYVVRNGILETCRAAEDVEGNTALNALLTPQHHQKA